MSREGVRGPRWGWLAQAMVLVVALGARVARWREAYWGPEVVPLDSDSLYHFRRSLQAAASLALPARDPAIDWPGGGLVPWAPGFDLLCGSVARLFGGPSSPIARAAVAAVPVALGVAVVALVMWLAARVASPESRRPAAVTAGLVAALLPQAISSSRFGRTDHHVAEALLAIGLACWAFRAVSEDRRPGLAHALAGVLLSAGGVLVFTGAPLYVALAAAPVGVTWLARSRASAEPWPGLGLLAGAGLAALAAAPQVAEHGLPLSFAYFSFLQPILIAALGLGLLTAWLACRVGSGWPRIAAVVAVAVVGLAAAALVPGVLRQVREAIGGWLFAHDPWLARVDEFQPVWSEAVGLRRAVGMWAWCGLALPVAAVAAAALLGARRPGPVFGLAFFALSLVALTALENRFGRAAIPVVASLAGAGIAEALGRLRAAGRVAAALGPAIVAGALLVDPAVWTALTPSADSSIRDAVVGASFDLKPRGQGSRAPGVLVPWDVANEVLVLGDRPVVVNGFGSYLDPVAFREVKQSYALPEEQLVAWMDSRALGYVVAGPLAFLHGRTPGPAGEDPAQGLAYFRAVPLSVSFFGGSGFPEDGIPHLGHLLPRFASVQVVPGSAQRIPAVWTFERVAGARVTGAAPARARVVLEIDLVARGRPWKWRAWADADAVGRYALSVPLPTGWSSATLATPAVGRVRAGTGPWRPVVVPEEAVRAGATVVVDLPGP